MHDAAALTQALVGARRQHALVSAAEWAQTLQTAAEAYAVQDAVASELAWFSFAPPGHWKSGGPSRDAVLTHAPLPPGGVRASGAAFDDWPMHSRAIEAEIAQLEEADRADFLQELGLEEPGLNRVIRAGYRLLGLQTYFTAGEKEVRAWTVKIGATAPQAAGVIHTDFEKGFIRAEVISYDDFITCKGEQGAKEAGKMRLEGKEYVVQDGDVINFRHAT